jgi:hypothetical protein
MEKRGMELGDESIPIGDIAVEVIDDSQDVAA